MSDRPKLDLVLAIVANYGFSTQADHLKRCLEGCIDTILIDNSSPIPPQNADLTLPNSYYTGLWNAAVKQALLSKKEWLLFIASDVKILDITSKIRK